MLCFLVWKWCSHCFHLSGWREWAYVALSVPWIAMHLFVFAYLTSQATFRCQVRDDGVVAYVVYLVTVALLTVVLFIRNSRLQTDEEERQDVEGEVDDQPA